MADFEVPPLEHSPWPTPSRAIYGFVLYVVSYVIFGAYIIWAIFPDSWLESVGISYLPARHWVITLPFLMWLGVALIAVIYGMMYLTSLTDLNDINTIEDHFTMPFNGLVQKSKGMPPIADLPIYQNQRFYST